MQKVGVDKSNNSEETWTLMLRKSKVRLTRLAVVAFITFPGVTSRIYAATKLKITEYPVFRSVPYVLRYLPKGIAGPTHKEGGEVR
jgi:hypothetical protein